MNPLLSLDNAVNCLKNIGLPLRKHQVEAVEKIIEWHNQGHGGILADEMGLGKTCEAVVSLAILSSSFPNGSLALIICPLSVIDHWENELKRFSCDKLQVFRYYGDKEKRVTLRLKLKSKKWNVLLTTFEIYLIDRAELSYKWDFAIFDEAHRVKNENSLLHNAVNASHISWSLLMTGTPVQNHLTELYALLKLADPATFPLDKMGEFVKKYSKTCDKQICEEFHTLFNNYCLRRTKKILSEVPSCMEVILHHGITKLQYELYKAVLGNNRDIFVRSESSNAGAKQSLMSVLIQLRKVCDHPYLFTGIEEEPFVEGEHLFTASGKVLILDRLLKYLKDNNHRVLIFSQMTRFLDIVNDCLTLRGYKFEVLDGRTRSEERLRAVENFQRTDSDVFCFLLSTKAGGFGLNLTAADTVIFLDWDFNPQNDRQAAARCHRIGQTKPVKIIRLIAKHTVEELIKFRVQKKLKLSEYVLGSDEEGQQITEAEFSNLLISGLHDLEIDEAAASEINRISDENLETIIGTTSKIGMWKETAEEVAKESIYVDRETEDEQPAPSMYTFVGKDYSKDRKALQTIFQQLSEQDENIEHKTKATRDIAQKIRPIKPRRILTPEEKEKLREKRKELEHQRRQRYEQEKLERKQALWASNNYESKNLEFPTDDHGNALSPGRIFNVLGDVTKPQRSLTDTSKNALIVQCVDDGGHYGVGGLFSVLRNLMPDIADRYELIARMDDLHTGDSHLIADLYQQQSQAQDFTGMDTEGEQINRTVSLVLCVVQSVYDRYLKTISKSSLEKCLKRIRMYAQSNDAKSVHLPMIWFGARNFDEASAHAMLTTQLCSYGINVYIYKFKREKGQYKPEQKKPRMDEILIENSEGTSDAASSVAIAETSQIDESESSDPDFEYDNEEEETDSDDDAECNDFDDDVLMSGNEKGTSKRHNK